MKTPKKKHIFQDIRFLILLTLTTLVIGILGFYLFHKKEWVTALYDATAILSAVGAADEPTNDAGKIFASFYTMFVGLCYILILAFVINAYADQSSQN
jgi:hypothetical protein